jgi:hypothetical protein
VGRDAENRNSRYRPVRTRSPNDENATPRLPYLSLLTIRRPGRNNTIPLVRSQAIIAPHSLHRNRSRPTGANPRLCHHRRPCHCLSPVACPIASTCRSPDHSQVASRAWTTLRPIRYSTLVCTSYSPPHCSLRCDAPSARPRPKRISSTHEIDERLYAVPIDRDPHGWPALMGKNCESLPHAGRWIYEVLTPCPNAQRNMVSSSTLVPREPVSTFTSGRTRP